MIRIGTSGWVYDDWRKRFYPAGLAQRNWLAYYTQHFDTVELNATTYRLPKEEHVARWCASVPSGFLFTVKLSRLITHRKTLAPRVDEFILNYMNRVRCFRPERLAQILCQFPPYLERDDGRLRTFLAKLPAAFRYVVEFRHKSWFVPQTYRILKEHNIAMCIHDYPRLRCNDVVTSADLAYVRLHGYLMLYAGSYPKLVLRRWRDRIRKLADQAQDVFVYFNNDTRGAAIKDAQTLRSMLAA